MSTAPTQPRQAYQHRLARRAAELSALRRRDLTLSLLRLALGLAAAAVAWHILVTHDLHWPWISLPLAGFGVAAWVHERIIRARDRAGRAVAFYEAGLARLDDRWIGRGVRGTEFLDPEHPNAMDLDLFGVGSLYERICTARTSSGRRTLAQWLCEPAAPHDVLERQSGVRELRDALDLREDLARLADDVQAADDPRALVAWASAAPVVRSNWPAWTGAALALLNTAGAVSWFAGVTSARPLEASAAASLALAWACRDRVRRILGGAGRAEHSLRLLAGVLARLERERFEAPRLRALRAALDVEGRPASRRIAHLARLVELVDSRRNMLFAPLGALWLSGTQSAFALERWRRDSGAAVAAWLAAVGEFEALSAFAALAFERPEDVFPTFATGGPCFDSEGLGHPLLPEAGCVRNDVRLVAPLRLLLVSGSNMSGKSTLLRTVGVNAVLAQAGAPVRARRLHLSPLVLGTCLNVRDSLQQGTSHFMAEIKRLRRLLDLGRASRPLLFLLDEVLHGTNSHDRRIGAEALIRQLLARGGAGLVTTHDLALAEIVGALGDAAANVHFEDRVHEGRLAFDYRLRPGVVGRSNALDLMRAVGFEV